MSGFVAVMSELSPKQLEAISGIVQGLPSSQIANTLNISTRTLERWRKKPEFAAAITRIQGNASRQVETEIVRDVTNLNSRIESLAAKSLDCLEQILDNPEARASDRVQAAKLLLCEWQRTQTPVMHEFAALEVLIRAGYLPHEHLLRLKQAVHNLTDETRAIFAGSEK